jgi:anti-sigma factor RsiW
MRCALERDVSEELIVGYCARTLDPETEAAFGRHIDSCAVCCQLVAAQKAVWTALDGALHESRDLPLTPDFDQRLFRRIHASENRQWWLWRALVPAAACAALAAGFLLRQPDAASIPAARPQPTLQIDQVEHALDDMDMLNQLGAAI